jgi:hypothetical protein
MPDPGKDVTRGGRREGTKRAASLTGTPGYGQPHPTTAPSGSIRLEGAGGLTRAQSGEAAGRALGLRGAASAPYETDRHRGEGGTEDKWRAVSRGQTPTMAGVVAFPAHAPPDRRGTTQGPGSRGVRMPEGMAPDELALRVRIAAALTQQGVIRWRGGRQVPGKGGARGGPGHAGHRARGCRRLPPSHECGTHGRSQSLNPPSDLPHPRDSSVSQRYASTMRLAASSATSSSGGALPTSRDMMCRHTKLGASVFTIRDNCPSRTVRDSPRRSMRPSV